MREIDRAVVDELDVSLRRRSAIRRLVGQSGIAAWVRDLARAAGVNDEQEIQRVTERLMRHVDAQKEDDQ